MSQEMTVVAWLRCQPAGEYRTAKEIAAGTGVGLGSVSSLLVKLVKGRGEVERITGHGPRGGYGYRLSGWMREQVGGMR